MSGENYNISNTTNENNYTIFNILNICRIIFYTPIVFLGGLVGSIAYDYFTFNEDDEKREEKKSD